MGWMSRANSTGGAGVAGSCCRAERRTTGPTAALTHAAMTIVGTSFVRMTTDSQASAAILSRSTYDVHGWRQRRAAGDWVWAVGVTRWPLAAGGWRLAEG